ncbi:ComF family protein [Salinimicrobium gaetbulicola]|uniref:ComF family protein n=1 Tax=Salinimicrobium gaetbulicola TaxID=999702 RepID=A0ABW3IH71_9FLAO
MFHDLLDLLFPRLCNFCETALLPSETVLCTDCLHTLPTLQNHLEPDNETDKIFYGRIPIENATSLLLFEKKGITQKLIHNLKYKGHQEIGSFLGKWLGEELKTEKRYKEITAVIPVPLHKNKLKKRGYNQVEKFGKEIAAALQVPYNDRVLLKKSASDTQTVKKRFARWGSIGETFVVEEPNSLVGAHILLVDDLVTTGATLEACSEKLLQIPGIKISIATMAVTH